MGMTSTAIMATLTAVSTAVGVVSSLSSASMQSQQAEYQSRMAELQGQQASISARKEAVEIQEAARQTKSRQVAQASAAGVDVTSTTVLDLLAETAAKAEEGRKDVLLTGATNQAAYQSQSSALSTAPSNYSSAGIFNAGSSLLSGASSIVSLGDKKGWFS